MIPLASVRMRLLYTTAAGGAYGVDEDIGDVNLREIVQKAAFSRLRAELEQIESAKLSVAVSGGSRGLAAVGTPRPPSATPPLLCPYPGLAFFLALLTSFARTTFACARPMASLNAKPGRCCATSTALGFCCILKM